MRLTRDPVHGPVLAVGAGGTAAEALDGIVVTCPPLDHETAVATVAAAGIVTAQDEIAHVLRARADESRSSTPRSPRSTSIL